MTILDDMINKYSPNEYSGEWEINPNHRYLLVEQSAYDRAVFMLATFDSLADAATEHTAQEEPQDWPIYDMVDLVTGQTFYPKITITWEPLP